MAELKREYVIPLRRKTMTAPKWRRTKKAVSVLKEFVRKHMKTENVIVCPELNEQLWVRGIKHPPGKVEVIAHKIQLGNQEKTLVNLIEIGVDEYVKAYKEAATKVPVSEDTTPAKDTKAENKVESKEDKKEEKKAEPKSDSIAKEVKKDE